MVFSLANIDRDFLVDDLGNMLIKNPQPGMEINGFDLFWLVLRNYDGVFCGWDRW